MRTPPIATGPIAFVVALVLAGCVVPPAHTTLEQFDHSSQFVQTGSLSSHGPIGQSPYADGFAPQSGFGPTPHGSPYGYGGSPYGGYNTPYLNYNSGSFGTGTHLTYGAPYPHAQASYPVYGGQGYGGYDGYGSGAGLNAGALGSPGVTLFTGQY